MQFLSRAIWVTSLKSLFYLCNLSSHWALSNCCDPLWESLHTPMIKITYTSTHILYFYTWKIASTSPIHPQIKLHVVPCLSLSKIIITMYGLYKKKDAYPKKVCHMPQSMSKKRRKRKYSPYQRYYMGERNHIKEFHPPSTKKNIHTLAHLDHGLWLVSPLDPVFDLAKYEKQVCHYILDTYRSTKKSH